MYFFLDLNLKVKVNIVWMIFSLRSIAMEDTSVMELRQRHPQPPAQPTITSQPQPPERREAEEIETTCCSRVSRWMQNTSYQIMAFTFWDSMMAGFKPGRVRAFELMDIKSTDKILLVGEGSGLDFECLPNTINKANLRAFDFSPEMVKQSKQKAPLYGIPEANCFVGDAQKLPFTTERFDKIFFPLSLASIPNPKLALQEAERVLERGGKIIVFEKLVDDGTTVSWGRKVLNIATQPTFADINRNLSQIMGNDSPLKIVHYESLENKLSGIAHYLGPYYRLAVLVRHADYPVQVAMRARPRAI